MPVNPDNAQEYSRQLIRLEEDERQEEEWLAVVIAACPPGTSLKLWRTSSGEMKVRITRSMKLGLSLNNPVGVSSVRLETILNVPESSSLTVWEAERSVAAQVSSAAWDMTLLQTTPMLMAVEEWCRWTDLRDKVIKDHAPTRCVGLTQSRTCSICADEYNDSLYGDRIAHKLSAIEVAWTTPEKEKEDTGFDPTAIQVQVSNPAYDPQEDSFARMVE